MTKKPRDPSQGGRNTEASWKKRRHDQPSQARNKPSLPKLKFMEEDLLEKFDKEDRNKEKKDKK